MKARDLLLYVVIALLVVLSATLYATWSVRHNLSPSESDAVFKWFAFFWFNCFVFGYVVKGVGAIRQRLAFWLLLLLWISVQSTIGVFALRQVQHFPLIYYVPISIVEIGILTGIARWTFQRNDVLQ
jgi:hypothetical protein